MSNQQVGPVYSKIIDEVINQCRAPFEEEGAQANVLEDFKKAWQQKITERKVATMPWDPAPPPPAATPAPAPQPRPQQQSQQSASQPTQQQHVDVKIKSEPGSQAMADLPSATPYSQHDPGLAYQNAAQNVEAKFGAKADASIRQINDRAQEASHGQKRPLPAGSPTQESFDAKKRMTDYNGSMHAHVQANIAQLGAAQQRPPNVGAAQTDGASEWSALVAERRALAATDSGNADVSIAERVKQLQRDEEGGGLLMPLSKQAGRSHRERIRDAKLRGTAGPSGFDGGDDDGDDEDEAKDDTDVDAINSDLDDDEDDIIDEDDDDARVGEIMVCTYEKVARVKNKWKCTLKDGILITGGREYIFSKATGEFEW